MMGILSDGFILSLVLTMLSASILLIPKVSRRFVYIHSWISLIPVGMASIDLIISSSLKVGNRWFHVGDQFGLTIAIFSLMVSFIIQRFSIRYLDGERSFRLYFFLFTLTSEASSLTWIQSDMRNLILFWGLSIIGISSLIRLDSTSNVSRLASRQTMRYLGMSWVCLTLACLMVFSMSGSFDITKESLAHVTSYSRWLVQLLLVLSVMLPAAQWPFQRWLFHSVVVPTPVSAIMHAGLVNIGGILLTRFSPLFGGGMSLLLIVISLVSITLGTWVSWIQADYKRQLVGSTMAQMGMMLLQCALGAYAAAIIHLMLHGFFKASLFLQAGSAVQPTNQTSNTSNRPIQREIIGILAGFLTSFVYLTLTPSTGNSFISAVLIGWAVFLSVRQLVDQTRSFEGLILKIVIGLLTISFYLWVHATFDVMVPNSSPYKPPFLIQGFILTWLVLSAMMNVLITRFPNSSILSWVYLKILALSDPSPSFIYRVSPKHHHLLIEGRD